VKSVNDVSVAWKINKDRGCILIGLPLHGWVYFLQGDMVLVVCRNKCFWFVISVLIPDTMCIKWILIHYAWHVEAVTLLVKEWKDRISRGTSHPTWVPRIQLKGRMNGKRSLGEAVTLLVKEWKDRISRGTSHPTWVPRIRLKTYWMEV